MMNWKILAARIISALVCVVGGGAMQIGFWKTPDRTYLEALAHYPYLWVFYLIVALLVGEHSLKMMKRRARS